MNPTGEGAVYVSVYQVASAAALVEAQHPTVVTRAFTNAVRAGEWPFDVGDDPSFFCAGHFSDRGGAPSWGTCRRDLRNALEPCDTVVFLGFQRRADGAVEYRLSGYATVERKVSQEDIWRDDHLSVYRDYLNLLVAPTRGEGLVHRESHPGRPHPDWLWRLTCSRGRSWRSGDFAAFDDPKGGRSFHPLRDRVGEEPIDLCSNYVIFSSDLSQTLILADPPVVARYHPTWGPTRPERWLDSPLASTIYNLTLARKPGRSLRLVSRDLGKSRLLQRHRHIRIPECTSSDWRGDAWAALEGLGVDPWAATSASSQLSRYHT